LHRQYLKGKGGFRSKVTAHTHTYTQTQRTDSTTLTRRHLRSANHQLPAVPHYRLNTYGRRAFSDGAGKVWNSLSRFHPGPDRQCRLYHLLKTYFFARY